MNRRDTILIAIFVNTGVLGLLFLMGVNKDEFVKAPEEIQMAQGVTLQLNEIAETTPILLSRPYEEPPEIEEDNDFDFDAETIVQKSPEEEAPLMTHGFFEVKVKRGDFLERIARANGTTVDEIKRVNQLTSEKISVGQIIRIPNKSQKKPEPIAQVNVAPQQKTTEAQAVYYTVKSGDNPWKIAKQFSIRVDELLKLNSLNETKAKNLKVGDKLRVK